MRAVWQGKVVSFKCYNVAKPAKWYLKLFEVSDARAGFIIGFEVYTGKKLHNMQLMLKFLILIVINNMGSNGIDAES